jgi:hypothetical protein
MTRAPSVEPLPAVTLASCVTAEAIFHVQLPIADSDDGGSWRNPPRRARTMIASTQRTSDAKTRDADGVPSLTAHAHQRRFGRSIRLLAMIVGLSIIALVGGGGAQSASAQTTSNEFGTLRVHRVTGHTTHGATFVGHYTIKRFIVRHHRVLATGRLTGTLTRLSGTTVDVSKRVRMPLNLAASQRRNLAGGATTSINAALPASCQVLNLVLGPLDVNLLGLVVHLDRVVLNITAVPGAGALLGNLLCAVVGLLDGTGIAGLNAILANLLNAILGILQA